MILAAFGVNVAAQPLTETAARVAFIFNFGKFVEWPPSAFEKTDRFRICYFGTAGPLFRELGRLEDKTVQNKTIAVVRITTASEVSGCAILAIAEEEARNPRKDLLRAAETANALTIGDAEGFAAAGGAISLVTTNDRVGFEINLDTARAANLRVPAQLARLGKPIQGKQ